MRFEGRSVHLFRRARNLEPTLRRIYGDVPDIVRIEAYSQLSGSMFPTDALKLGGLVLVGVKLDPFTPKATFNGNPEACAHSIFVWCERNADLFPQGKPATSRRLSTQTFVRRVVVDINHLADERLGEFFDRKRCARTCVVVTFLDNVAESASVKS